MTKYERCSNCSNGKISKRPRTFLDWIFDRRATAGRYIRCPYAVDGVVTWDEYDQICELGCGSFVDNAPKKV